MYTYQDAKYLLQYYADKVIGKPLEDDRSTIVSLRIDEYKEGFDVNCVGTELLPRVVPFKSIYTVAPSLGLLTPKEVLQQRNL